MMMPRTQMRFLLVSCALLGLVAFIFGLRQQPVDLTEVIEAEAERYIREKGGRPENCHAEPSDRVPGGVVVICARDNAPIWRSELDSLGRALGRSGDPTPNVSDY